MSLTLRDVCDKLLEVDEISLLERLDISSEELVERFLDKIEDRYEEFEREFENDE